MNVPLPFRDLALSESGFVFDPMTGASYSVNSTGLVILQGLREGLNRSGLLALLADRFDAAEADLDRDLSDFLQVLRREGLVPLDFEA